MNIALPLKAYIKLLIFVLFVEFILCTFLLCNGYFGATSTWGYVKHIVIYLTCSFFTTNILFLFIWFYFIFLSDNKYRKPWGFITLIILVLLSVIAFIYLNFIYKGENQFLKLIQFFFIFKAMSFGMRLFFRNIRINWSYYMYSCLIFVYIFFVLLNAVGEYFFWEELGLKYYIFMIDYFIKGNRLVSDIIDIYPIIPIFSIIILISLILTMFFVKKQKELFEEYPRFKTKLITSLAVTLLAIISFGGIIYINSDKRDNKTILNDDSQYNGMYSLYEYFFKSRLRYQDNYVRLPKEKALKILRKEYGLMSNGNFYKSIGDSLPEFRKNIVLITINNFDNDFLKISGNTENLTPNINKLITNSLFFENVYATGNSSRQGLESLILSIPPNFEENFTKRNYSNKIHSIVEILKNKSYNTQFFYGGNISDVNMGDFLKINNYEVFDKKTFKKDEISFLNIWGTCDEDIFKKAIKKFDQNSKSNKPFFGHIITLTNKKPFTYPEGKIDISPNQKSREGAIKYVDYAIGNFIQEAQKKEWFNNTIFVIAGGNAFSSNKENPIKKYNIPVFIYAPTFIKPNKTKKITSQIDIMPTLFGILNFSYKSYFYGQDIYDDNYTPRALMTNGKELGYLEEDVLTILTPKKEVNQYRIIKDKITPLKPIDSLKSNKAIGTYQSINYFIINNKLK